MVLEFSKILVPVLFGCFVALDIASVFPRIAGSMIGKNGIAYAFQVMTNTVKRVFIVSYPPLLGLISISGTINDLFSVLFISYTVAILVFLIVVFSRISIVAFFFTSLQDFSDNGEVFRSIIKGFQNSSEWTGEVRHRLNHKGRMSDLFSGIDRKIVVPAVWIFFFYSASPFLINVLGMIYRDYSSVILQLTGLSNAFGTIALAFFLDPKLARFYERQSDLPAVSRSLLLAHLINLGMISPLFFFCLFMLL